MISEISSIMVYEKVLSGELPKFPVCFWDKNVAKILVRYALCDKRNMSRNEICKMDIRRKFKEIKLSNVLKLFNTQYAMIQFIFPELEIYPWELRKVSNSFWKEKKNRLEALLWLAKTENVDLENITEVREKITARVVYKYFGNKALKYSDESMYAFLDLYYNGRYKEWELMKKISVWTEPKVIDAVHYIVSKKNLKNKEEIATLTVADFRSFGLEGMLEKACRHSPLKALQIAYPEYNYTNKEVKSVKF